MTRCRDGADSRQGTQGKSLAGAAACTEPAMTTGWRGPGQAHLQPLSIAKPGEVQVRRQAGRPLPFYHQRRQAAGSSTASLAAPTQGPCRAPLPLAGARWRRRGAVALLCASPRCGVRCGSAAPRERPFGQVRVCVARAAREDEAGDCVVRASWRDGKRAAWVRQVGRRVPGRG